LSNLRPYSFSEDIRRVLRVPPPATLALFLISVGAFIGQVFGGSSDWQRAVGLIPANVADAPSLLRVGDTQLLPACLTLFSYMFLHGGSICEDKSHVRFHLVKSCLRLLNATPTAQTVNAVQIEIVEKASLPVFGREVFAGVPINQHGHMTHKRPVGTLAEPLETL